jgi:hypothetical protein
MDRQERRVYNREYRKQNREKIKAYCRLHKSKINEYSRLYRLNYGSKLIPLSIEEQEIKIIKAPITIYFS